MDAAGMAYQQNTIRIIIFLLSTVGCVLFAWKAWRKPARRLLFVAPLAWMVNMSIFYACRLIGWPANIYIVNIWSQMIHLQALITLIGGLIIYERK